MLSSLLWLFIFIIGIIYFIKTRNDGYSVYEAFYGDRNKQKYTYDDEDDPYGDDDKDEDNPYGDDEDDEGNPYGDDEDDEDNPYGDDEDDEDDPYGDDDKDDKDV